MLALEDSVIAVGAYGYYLQSQDEGETWSDKLVNEEHDFHLNAISARNNKELFIAGESGQIYRSLDAGSHWQTLNSPYEGSFFDVVSWGRQDVAVVGLRGHIYYSSDNGDNWQQTPTNIQTSLNSVITMSDNFLLVVGHAGVLLLVDVSNRKVYEARLDSREDLADVVLIDEFNINVVGENGVSQHKLCLLFPAAKLQGCP